MLEYIERIVLLIKFFDFFQEILANVSGQPGAANFSEISDEIKSAVDYIVGFRQDDMNKPKPSSIIKLEKGGVIKIIRE